jgi:hypothetical protein
MSAFLYLCPTTGQRVQGWSSVDPAGEPGTVEAIKCLACGRLHLIDPKTAPAPARDPGK